MDRSQSISAVRVAVAHATPVIFDKERTILKIESLTAEAARCGAELVVFGESFLPGFPVWNLVHAPIDQHGFFAKLHANSIVVPGPETLSLGRIARKNGVALSVGVSERPADGIGTMWNSSLLFDSSGTIVNHHRKMMPTWAERLSWALGDAAGLRTVETAIGKIGTLICGENFNTLARFSLLAQGETIHIATYPPMWPTSWSVGEGDYDLTEAIRIRSAAHAIEGKVFNIVAACSVDQETIETWSDGNAKVRSVLEESPRGASMILGPTGEYIAGPVQGEEQIVYGQVDLSRILAQRELHDITGHYNRFDIFSLSVNCERPHPVRTTSGGSFQDFTMRPDRKSETGSGDGGDPHLGTTPHHTDASGSHKGTSRWFSPSSEVRLEDQQ